MKYAISFSGGTESMQLLKMFKHLKPILLCFIHDEMQSIKDALKYIAKNEGLEIHFIEDLTTKSFAYKMGFDIISEIPPLNHIWKAKYYVSDLLSLAKKLGVTNLLIGVRAHDFIHRRQAFLEGDKLLKPENMKSEGIILEFPLWDT